MCQADRTESVWRHTGTRACWDHLLKALDEARFPSSVCANSGPSGPVGWSVHLVLLPEGVSCPVNLSCVHLFPGVSTDLAGDVCCWVAPLGQALGLKMGRRWAQGGRAPKTQRSQMKPFSYPLRSLSLSPFLLLFPSSSGVFCFWSNVSGITG